MKDNFSPRQYFSVQSFLLSRYHLCISGKYLLRSVGSRLWSETTLFRAAGQPVSAGQKIWICPAPELAVLQLGGPGILLDVAYTFRSRKPARYLDPWAHLRMTKNRRAGRTGNREFAGHCPAKSRIGSLWIFWQNLLATSFYNDHKEWFWQLFDSGFPSRFFWKTHGRGLAILVQIEMSCSSRGCPAGNERSGDQTVTKNKKSSMRR